MILSERSEFFSEQHKGDANTQSGWFYECLVEYGELLLQWLVGLKGDVQSQELTEKKTNRITREVDR